jgi:ribosomal protein L37E
MTYELILNPDGTLVTAIKCLRCGLVSHHPRDMEELYCGHCHQFHVREAEPGAKQLSDRMICLYCQEPVDDDELEHMRMHKACMFRSVAGSVAHIERRCGCYVPGSAEGDPPGMTLRQAAEAAVDTWRRKQLTKLRKTEAYERHIRN